MRITIFEAEPREQAYIGQRLPTTDVSFIAEPLRPETAARASDSTIVSIFIRSTVDQAVIDRLPNLQLISTRSTGYDHIDLAACAERGITVSNVPTYGENTVAEHTFGLILALTRKIHQAWFRTQQDNWSLAGLEGFDLKGKTLGVVGAGNIGKHVIRIARGFGMEVVAHDLNQDRILAEVLGFQYVSLEELLASADIVSLHVPALPATHHLMNRDTFALMKPGALLINTARGSIVDTNALMRALDDGILGGAGLDVIEGEELIQEERELLNLPEAGEKLRLLLQQHVLSHRENVVVTPHIGFYSREALNRIMDTTIDNIAGFLAGSPANAVLRPEHEE